MNIARLTKLQSRISYPLLIKKKENLLYLTGQKFDQRAVEYLLVKPSPRPSPGGRGGVVGFASGLEKISWAPRSDRFKNLGKYVSRRETLELSGEFTYAEVAYFKNKNPGLKIKVVLKPNPVDIQRTVKEPGEIALVKKSMQVVGKVFEQVKKELKRKKWTERKLAQFIQETGFKLGAEDISFPAIVASGANATIPHHAPSSKPLRPGETIILDFGFKYKNYCSDFTRTVFLKSAPRRLANIYNQVEKAHTESIQLISYSSHVIPEATSAKREGYPESRRIDSRSPITVEDEFRGNDKRESGNDKKITGSDVYQKAVSVLAEEDLDKYFIHNLGHGTGLEIHELPNLSPGSKDILANGMVFSIEPGVYLPNVGGVRIEDLVYLEDGKANKFINVSTSLEANLIK